jgi:hypothetical protein
MSNSIKYRSPLSMEISPKSMDLRPSHRTIRNRFAVIDKCELKTTTGSGIESKKRENLATNLYSGTYIAFSVPGRNLRCDADPFRRF